MGLLSALAVGPAEAAQAGSGVQAADFVASSADTAVAPVSYTTGAAGHQLKWLPARPTTGPRLIEPRRLSGSDRAVRPAAAEQPLQLTPPATNALADPFGDHAPQMSPPMLLNSGDAEGTPSASSDLLTSPLDPPTDAPRLQPTLQPVPTGEAAASSPGSNRGTANDAPSQIPSLEEELAQAPQPFSTECPSPKDLKSIRKIDYKIAAEPGEFPRECSLGNERFMPRAWDCTTFTWTASALCHKPLYFEEVQLERYGHSWGPCLQPVLSGAHFFLTIPALPYLMGVYPPNECIYTLGYYRPGNCAPYLLDPIPLSVRGALYEGGVATGLAFLIP